MKTALILLTLCMSAFSFAATTPAEKSYKFTYRMDKQIFEVSKVAANKDIAFKLAAKDCFNQLTGGKYPGEERGLDIIDICANPKM